MLDALPTLLRILVVVTTIVVIFACLFIAFRPRGRTTRRHGRPAAAPAPAAPAPAAADNPPYQGPATQDSPDVRVAAQRKLPGQDRLTRGGIESTPDLSTWTGTISAAADDHFSGATPTLAAGEPPAPGGPTPTLAADSKHGGRTDEPWQPGDPAPHTSVMPVIDRPAVPGAPVQPPSAPVSAPEPPPLPEPQPDPPAPATVLLPRDETRAQRRIRLRAAEERRQLMARKPPNPPNPL